MEYFFLPQPIRIAPILQQDYETGNNVITQIGGISSESGNIPKTPNQVDSVHSTTISSNGWMGEGKDRMAPRGTSKGSFVSMASQSELMQGREEGNVPLTMDNVEKFAMDQNVPNQYAKETQDFWNVRKLVKVAYWWHLVCFASAMILSASCFSWNLGLQIAGFPLYSVCVVLNGIAFQILAMCLAELCSGHPFNGGSYGFVRATIGTKTGYFVGLIESLEYIMTSAVNAIQTTTILQLIFNTDPKYNIIWDISLLVLATTIQIIGGDFYWTTIAITGSLTMLVLIMYGVGSLQYIGNYESDPEVVWTVGGTMGITAFMEALPNSIWFYVGIEGLPLCSEETHESQEHVPTGLVWGMAIVVLISFFVYFTAVATPQNDLLGSSYPLTAGYAMSWNIDLTDNANRCLLVFALIPCFSAMFAFIFCYGRLMFAMSRSGLLPMFMSLTTDFSGTPYIAMIFGSSVGIVLLLLIRLAPNGADINNYVYNMMLLTAVMNYLFQLTAYIILRLEYGMVKRNYESPLGVPGAVVAFLIFLLGYIALLGWTPNIIYPVIGVSIWIGVGMAYYFLFSANKLILSPEEKYSLFLVYSLKFSKSQHKQMMHKKYIAK